MNITSLSLALALACSAAWVHADPEPVGATPAQVRQMFIDLYQAKFPDKKPDDYTLGALMLSADAKSQYDSIMDFPPFLDQVDAGHRLWDTPFRNGKTYASCFPHGGHMIAGNYPKYDAQHDRVVTFEDALNACRAANGAAPYKLDDPKTMGALSAYARSLSDGMRVNVKVDGPGALARFKDGERIYFSRHGQLNFSCASCHMANAGNVLRTEILSPTVGQATHWPVFRAGIKLNTIQMRYQKCFEQIRATPPAIGSQEMNDLEYFHTYLSNGLPMQANVYRK